jgi:hypothetical protein
MLGYCFYPATLFGTGTIIKKKPAPNDRGGLLGLLLIKY